MFMDLIRVKVIGDMLADKFPALPKQLILLAVMRVVREHEVMSAQELEERVCDEMERFQKAHPAVASQRLAAVTTVNPPNPEIMKRLGLADV